MKVTREQTRNESAYEDIDVGVCFWDAYRSRLSLKTTVGAIELNTGISYAPTSPEQIMFKVEANVTYKLI